MVGIFDCEDMWRENLSGDFCRGSAATLLAIGFLSDESWRSLQYPQGLLRSSAEQGTVVPPAVWLILVALHFFFLVPSHI